MHWFCLSVEEVELIIIALETVVSVEVPDEETAKIIEKLRFMLAHER